MSILQALYQLLITPIELLLEMIYGFSFLVLENLGAAIIPLSLAINLLLLPLYKRADAITNQEQEIQKKMASGIAHIKKTFKGDERYMMLQTFYRQNGYKPIYSLRSSIPLLLQVPFFIAAYHFLSNYTGLEGTRFLFLSDLGKPDQLLNIGGHTINVLPIAMTLINIISSMIYTKGKPMKDKIQLHAMALIFLFLLYNSPSGLVFYWTLNNVFSLFKNLVAVCKKPLLASRLAYLAIAVSILAYDLLLYEGKSTYRYAMMAIALFFTIPALQMLPSKELTPNSKKKESSLFKMKKSNYKIFLYGAIFLTFLTGLLIPSEVIRSSPSEFVLLGDFKNPLFHLLSASLLAAGTFILWMSLFYFLSSEKIRKILCITMWGFSIIGLSNYIFFGKSLGLITAEFRYELDILKFPLTDILINLGAVIGLAVVLTILLTKLQKVVIFIYPVLILAVLGVSIVNAVNIQKAVPQLREVFSNPSEENPSFQLSKDGKNVVVIMMDRQVSRYVPFIFQERPELEEKFSGFTWYPNTLSFGATTNVGVPGLFGGYDYMPEKLNARNTELMVDKHNEALKVMPVIFSQNNFKVTVCDPPYAGYSRIPDLSIFDEYSEITTYNTETGQLRDRTTDNAGKKEIWQRNFFCYSFMKLMPLAFQDAFYQNGTYFSNNNLDRIHHTLSNTKSIGLNDEFMDSYASLCAYPEMTNVVDSSENTFMMIENGTCHNIMMLQEPEYEPSLIVDNTEYEAAHQDRFTCDGLTMEVETGYRMSYYHVNMAAMIKLADWLDYLREQGVYDNTRIIIVSDHGFSLEQFDDTIFGSKVYSKVNAFFNPEDALAYNAMLLVKDFGSNEPFRTDYTFMTNADTPSLAFEGLIDSPVNPFTGTAMDDTSAKLADELHVFYTNTWEPELNNGYTYLPGLWCALSNQNIFDKENWKEVGVY